MAQDRRITYTVRHPVRLAIVLAASVSIILLAIAWALFLGRTVNKELDLAAYTSLTRTGDTVTAVLDADSLLAELDLPNPRTDPQALRNRVVKTLLSMELDLAFTEEPDVIQVTADLNEGVLLRRGIGIRERTWTSQAKVVPPSAAPEEAQEALSAAERPRTVLADGYLTSLLDEEGKGLNLQKAAERVQFERDRLAKEIFGNSYVTEKTKLWFILYPEGSEPRNAYRAVFTLTETGAPEGRSIGRCAFTVDVVDLSYQASSGVSFAKTDVVLYDTLAEAEDLTELTARGCTVAELVGGSMEGPPRPSFDYNGFVRFVGLPMSHPLPDGSLWSPSSDVLEEDDLWRLVGNGEYTMAELLTYVRMEILARHGYTFPELDQAAYRAHFDGCGWYAPTEDAPEQFFTPTERRNWTILLGLEALLDS